MFLSNPRKKMKTEDGPIVTLKCEAMLNESDDEDATVLLDHSLDVNAGQTNRESIQPALMGEQAATIGLLDMNDDCLNEIFDLKFWSVVDLCSVALTCTRLNAIGTKIFERKHKICDFKNIVVENSVMASTVLNAFGTTISELQIDLSPYSFGAVRIIDSIIQDCSALTSLTLESYKIPDNHGDITKIGRLFKKLKRLHLNHIYIEGFEELDFDERNVVVTPNRNLMDFFKNCDSLIELKIVCCCNLERAIFESYFPKLQHFEYDIATDDLGCQIDGFILRHDNLRSFRLECANDVNSVNLNALAASCKNLEKLALITASEYSEEEYASEYATSLKHLELFDHLIELKIRWAGQLTPLIKQFRSKALKVLDLEDIQGCPELIPAISMLQTLTVLKLFNLNDIRNLSPLGELDQLIELSIVTNEEYLNLNFDFIEIVKRLINLKKFRFDVNHFTIRPFTYVQLVNIVKNRSKVENRHLLMNCRRTTDDFTHLLCPTVEFNEFE